MSRILVALDVSSMSSALALAEELADHVAGFKVGLQLMTSSGPRAVEEVAKLGKPVFADAKLHDIPNTVEHAAANLAAAGARWVTAHVSGGAEMMKAAVAGVAEGSGGESGILGVTVLTSLNDGQLDELGMTPSVTDRVTLLARLAERDGAEGLICSPNEIAIVKATVPRLTVVTPGIRLEGGATHDQRRVATPTAAMRAGADYLVIGRAITSAPDPVDVARSIAQSLDQSR